MVLLVQICFFVAAFFSSLLRACYVVPLFRRFSMFILFYQSYLPPALFLFTVVTHFTTGPSLCMLTKHCQKQLSLIFQIYVYQPTSNHTNKKCVSPYFCLISSCLICISVLLLGKRKQRQIVRRRRTLAALTPTLLQSWLKDQRQGLL